MTTRRPHGLPRAAFALVILLPLGPAARSMPAAGPALTTAGSWHLQALPASARRNILSDVADTIPAAGRVLDLVDGAVAIDADVAACGPAADSCSYREPSGAATPWRIHLSADTATGTYPSQRFYLLHEAGHAVWGLVFDDRDRAAFARAVAQSLHGRPCLRVRDGRPCAVIFEVFADEFARWAGGFHANMTGYQTPPLLDRATMTRVVDDAVVRGAAA